MAILGVNPVSPRPKKDKLDKIAQGFGIASQVLGTTFDIANFFQNKKQAQAAGERADRDLDIQEKGLTQRIDPTKQEIDQLTLEEKRRVGGAPDQATSGMFRSLFPGQSLPATQGLAESLIKSRQDKSFITDPQRVSMETQTKGLAFREKDEQRKADKEEQRKQQLLIPGLNQSVFDPKEARDIRQAMGITTSVLNNIDSLIKQREELSDEIGGGTLDPAKRKAAISKMRQIQLDVKGPEYANLGVLAGPDMTIVEDLAPTNPLAKSVIKGLGLDDPIMAQLKELRSFITNKINTSLTARGLNVPGDYWTPQGGVAQTQQTPQASQKKLTEADIDNMSIEELKAAGLL